MEEIVNLLYPPSCLCCQTLLKKNVLFCDLCFREFSLLPKEGHCSKCFAEITSMQGTCLSCRQLAHPFRTLVACFDSYGPGKTLLQTFLQEKTPSLAKIIASYIVVQLEKLSISSLEGVTLVPRGIFSPFLHVAKEVAEMLQIPFYPILKRQWTPDPQFSLKKKCDIINKVIVLLDTEMQERNEMRTAGWVLKEGLPQTVYGMTFCATLD